MCNEVPGVTEGIDAVLRPTWHRFRQTGRVLLLGTPLLGVPVLTLVVAIWLVRRILAPPSSARSDRGPTAVDLIAFLGAVPASVVLLLMALDQDHFGGPLWLVSGSFSWIAFGVFAGIFPLGLVLGSLLSESRFVSRRLTSGASFGHLVAATVGILGTVGVLIGIVAVTKAVPATDSGWYEVRDGQTITTRNRRVFLGEAPRQGWPPLDARPAWANTWRPSARFLSFLTSDGLWKQTSVWAYDRVELAPLRHRDQWVACPDAWQTFDDCAFVDDAGTTTPASQFVIEGVEGIPSTWLLPPAVGLALALLLLAGAWQARLRWFGFLDAEHIGDGLVRMAPGDDPVLVPDAVAMPRGPIVLRTNSYARSGTTPYRRTAVMDAEVEVGRLDALLAHGNTLIARRLTAALFLLVFLGAPLATAVIYLR